MRGRRVRVVGLAVIVGLIVSINLSAGPLASAWAAGEPVPDIALKTQNGDLRLADQKGKVLVLYFSFPG